MSPQPLLIDQGNLSTATTGLTVQQPFNQAAFFVINQGGTAIEAVVNDVNGGSGPAVIGLSPGDGVRGIGIGNNGLYALSRIRSIYAYSDGAGIETWSRRRQALLAFNESPFATIWVQNLTQGWAAGFDGDVVVFGNFIVQGGNKNAVVDHPDGSQRLLYCMEAPEAWTEDFGRASLRRGKATVALEPKFAALVADDSYHVFLTAEGDCEGLYVANQSSDSFDVRELRGGTSDISFSYRIAVKRPDVDAERFKSVDLPEPPDMAAAQQRAREADAELRQRIDSLANLGGDPDAPN